MRCNKSPVGWRGESYRHYLSAKGISTKNKYFQKQEFNRPLREMTPVEARAERERLFGKPGEINRAEAERFLKGFGGDVIKLKISEAEEEKRRLMEERDAAILEENKKIEEREKIKNRILSTIERTAREEERRRNIRIRRRLRELRAEELLEEAEGIHGDEFDATDDAGEYLHFKRIFTTESKDDADNFQRLVGLPTRVKVHDEGYAVYLAVGRGSDVE
jgi:hypothetical protein